jgi:hypothetical protein
MVRVIEGLAGDWRRLDERIESLSGEIGAVARQDAGCARLMSVPGIGPIISSAMVAAIGTGDVFSKGRDFAACLRSSTNRSRLGTAPSWARYPSAAIATCGFRSFRLLGSCSSSPRLDSGLINRPDLEGLTTSENAPGDAGELIGELLGGLDPGFEPVAFQSV